MEHLEAVNTLAIERYLLEEMPQEERDAFEEHFFSCAECADDVREAAAMREGVRAGLDGRRRSAQGTRRPPTGRPDAAGSSPLALVGRAAVGSRRAACGRTRLPDRGGAVVAAPPRWFVCADTGDAASGQSRSGSGRLARARRHSHSGGGSRRRAVRGRHRYELARADGKTVASGRRLRPRPERALLLMVPNSMLAGSERFVLTLHGAGASSLTPVTYRFRVRVP